MFPSTILTTLLALLTLATAIPSRSPANSGTSLWKRTQDFDPNSIICAGDSDCTDPGYPYCVCASFFGAGGATGAAATYVYDCASECGADGCVPDCDDCAPCQLKMK
ncbi:hypothetical protein MMC08_004454 [Hypocenomyce scalaris]|nr:hypothetical protein [Hypocenomyce scalaris]